MNKILIDTIKDLASKKSNSDNSDFNTLNYGNGNFDDIYEMGVNDGEVLLARKLLEMINKS